MKKTVKFQIDSPLKMCEKNFFQHTFCVFEKIDDDTCKNVLSTEPDYVSYSGSMYWYTDEGVYRYADHWGEVASCNWLLKNDGTIGVSNHANLGYAEFTDFKENINKKEHGQKSINEAHEYMTNYQFPRNVTIRIDFLYDNKEQKYYSEIPNLNPLLKAYPYVSGELRFEGETDKYNVKQNGEYIEKIPDNAFTVDVPIKAYGGYDVEESNIILNVPQMKAIECFKTSRYMASEDLHRQIKILMYKIDDIYFLIIARIDGGILEKTKQLLEENGYKYSGKGYDEYGDFMSDFWQKRK